MAIFPASSSATIAAAPGWRIIARSISTPFGSEACSTPRSTTPSFNTCRRLESIHSKMPEFEAHGTRGHTDLFRLRLDAVLHRMANRERARERNGLRVAMEGRADLDP